MPGRGVVAVDPSPGLVAALGASGILLLLFGAGLLYVDSITQANPGGPACTRPSCPEGGWYAPSTHSAELLVGLIFLGVAAVLLGSWVARLFRRSRARSVTR